MPRLLVFAPAIFPVALAAQATSSSPAPKPPAAMAAIKESDLRRDVNTMAGDAMRGREAGTLDEMRASGWVAEEMRKIGVQPMGEDGSWYQWWNMRRTRLSAGASTIQLGERALTMWTEIAPTSNAVVDVTG